MCIFILNRRTKIKNHFQCLCGFLPPSPLFHPVFLFSSSSRFCCHLCYLRIFGCFNRFLFFLSLVVLSEWFLKGGKKKEKHTYHKSLRNLHPLHFLSLLLLCVRIKKKKKTILKKDIFRELVLLALNRQICFDHCFWTAIPRETKFFLFFILLLHKQNQMFHETSKFVCGA